MKLVIKIGTQAILSKDGIPFEETIFNLVKQIAKLQAEGHHVILVSSGAVGSGRRMARQLLGREYGHSIAEKQVLASIGQHDLMQIYARMFKEYNILASQLLLTRQDFQTRTHYLNIARLLREILDHKNIVPIINENDSVAIEELMFTDNDELSGLIALQMNADKLIILSNINGVYDKNPEQIDAKLISIIDPNLDELPKISTEKNLHGRGGMLSKLNTALKVSDSGVTVHIANLNEDNVIFRIIDNELIGTKIIASKNKSNIKKWIAFNSDRQNGSIYVNSCLSQLLKENKKALSILPVGIEKLQGIFKKGDLVEVLSPEGKKIAVGISKYDYLELDKYIGQKNSPEFIHYDYLQIVRV